MLQVNTEPKMNLAYNLRVVRKYIFIDNIYCFYIYIYTADSTSAVYTEHITGWSNMIVNYKNSRVKWKNAKSGQTRVFLRPLQREVDNLTNILIWVHLIWVRKATGPTKIT